MLGNVLQAEGIRAPVNLICYSIITTTTGYNVACSADDQATIFSLDKNLRSGNLPSGYNPIEAVQDWLTLKAVSMQLSSLNSATMVSVLSPNILQTQTNQIANDLPLIQTFPNDGRTRVPTKAPQATPTYCVFRSDSNTKNGRIRTLKTVLFER